jgi:hypothetical protein
MKLESGDKSGGAGALTLEAENGQGRFYQMENHIFILPNWRFQYFYQRNLNGNSLC